MADTKPFPTRACESLVAPCGGTMKPIECNCVKCDVCGWVAATEVNCTGGAAWMYEPIGTGASAPWN